MKKISENIDQKNLLNLFAWVSIISQPVQLTQPMSTDSDILKSMSLAIGLCLSLASLYAQNRVRREIPEMGPRTALEQQNLFHLPPGFRIELVAAEPDIRKPINMNFDAAGRLFVSQSVEYPFTPSPSRQPRDSIILLTDEDNNGVPEKVIDFAAGLSIPVGITPIPGGAIGLSIPNLYRFLDDDGDGKADRREVAYGRFGYGDTHGMVSSLTWWIDGWIYGCHSNNNQSTAKGSDGHAIEIKTGNTHRFRPDGSHIEFFTLGQVNPFGITFDPLGNIFNADCHTKPIYMLLRGGYYPDVTFKGHDGLGFAPAMMRHTHGSTGLAGIVYYAAAQFPESYHNTIFIGNPVTGRINHDRLVARGSSYRAIEQPDFLSCDDPWFRPVDLQQAPDGSLYVADFYSPIIAHYEVPLTHSKRDRQHGRIWRISYVGEDGDPPKTGPDLTEASLDELLGFLSHANLVVRTHATHQLVHRIGQPAGQRIKAMLADGLGAEQRAHGLWVLARLGVLDVQTIHQLAADDQRLVRVHLMKALAEKPEWQDEERSHARRALTDDDAFVRRAAVEALGRHPHPGDIKLLIDLWEGADNADTHLIHATRIALRNAIEQLNNLPALASRYDGQASYLARLANICLGIKSAQSAQFLLNYRQDVKPEEERLGEEIHHIGRYLNRQSLPAFYRFVNEFGKNPETVRLTVFNAAYRSAQERGEKLPDDLIQMASQLAQTLVTSSDPRTVNSALGIIQEFEIKEAAPTLIEMALNASRPGARRRGRQPLPLDALVAADEAAAVSTFVQLLKNPGYPSGPRWRMELAIGKMKRPESYEALIQQLRISSEVVETTLVRGLSRSIGGVRALLIAVEQGRLSPRILRDPRVSVNLQYANIPDLDNRLALLVHDLPPENEDLYNLIADCKTGFQDAKPDLTRGKELFVMAFSICHQINGEGGHVGPQLDGVGIRGLDRLLEDIIDPNRNVDASYRASNIVLQNDRLFSGRVLREEGEVLVMVDAQGIEQRIPRSEIKKREQLKASSMPENLMELMNEQGFHDLIGYLIDQR